MDAEEMELLVHRKQVALAKVAGKKRRGEVWEVSSQASSVTEYVESFRSHLDVEEVGKELALLFMAGLKKGDMNVVRALGPYVLGRPEIATGVGQHDSVEIVLQAMRRESEDENQAV